MKNKNGHKELLFEDINLPETSNDPLSHGYITYKVKPITTIAVGNTTSNLANIYFDYNSPLTTNTAFTTIIANLSTQNFALNNLNYYPNPAKNSQTISNSEIIKRVEISTILGQTISTKTVNSLQTELHLSELLSGI